MLLIALPFLENGDKTPIIDMISGVAHCKAATQILSNDKDGDNQKVHNVNYDDLFTF